ncbi:hypothetical protein NQZ68_040449 [Dissostichus eleginoides]|nr:hypothetical protein NQZ68_040449 [Dissostichus eleginoides]
METRSNFFFFFFGVYWQLANRPAQTDVDVSNLNDRRRQFSLAAPLRDSDGTLLRPWGNPVDESNAHARSRLGFHGGKCDCNGLNG